MQNTQCLRLPDLYVGKLLEMSDSQLRQVLSDNPKEASVWIRMAAMQGITAAQIRLGRMLLEGQGLSKNPAAAVTWFQSAADSGDDDAINMLGRCYENGWGVMVNPELAFQHYLRAAQLANAWAQYNLGHCYLDGNGTQRDLYRAFFWYGQAVTQGHGRAMNLLARCYEEGWGVARDMSMAYHWYQKSAESGYFRGQFNWASILADAGQTQAAAEWFLQAARNGTQNVRRTVANVLRASRDAELQAFGLTALEYCCEHGDAQDCYRYAQALLTAGAGKPELDKAEFWLQRAEALSREPANLAAS